MQRLGTPSWRDFTWDVIGTATGLLVSFLVDLAVRAVTGEPRPPERPAEAPPDAGPDRPLAADTPSGLQFTDPDIIDLGPNPERLIGRHLFPCEVVERRTLRPLGS